MWTSGMSSNNSLRLPHPLNIGSPPQEPFLKQSNLPHRAWASRMPEASTRTERDCQTQSLQTLPPQVGDSERVTSDMRRERKEAQKDAGGSETDWVPVADLLVWLCYGHTRWFEQTSCKTKWPGLWVPSGIIAAQESPSKRRRSCIEAQPHIVLAQSEYDGGTDFQIREGASTWHRLVFSHSLNAGVVQHSTIVRPFVR